MKISNRSQIRVMCHLFLVLIGVSLGGLFLSYKDSAGMLFFTLLLILVLLILNVRYLEIDVSGGCFTIRKAHPFSTKRYISPTLEFPKSSIKYFSVSEDAFLDCIKIRVKSNSYEKSFRFYTFLFTRKQMDKLRRSIQMSAT